MPNRSIAPIEQQDDEIDLSELIAKLWQGKLIIAGVTALSIAAAAGYAFTTKEEWTSRASIEQPRAEDLGDYYQAQQQLWRIANNDSANNDKTSAVEKKKRLEITEVSKQVFDSTITQLSSPDARRAFWQGSDYYRQHATKLSSERAQKALLEKLSLEDIKLTPPDQKKQLYHQIEITAETPEVAQQLLNTYMAQINRSVWAAKAREYQVASNTLKLDLQDEKQNLALQQQAQDRSLLEATKRARDTAARGGVDTFKGSSYQTIEKPEMLFLLGTRSLQARIDSLKQTDKTPYPARYYQLDNHLKQIDLLPALKGSKQSFHYLEAPTQPITRDKPKRALIMALGAIAGLMLGSLIVLGRGAFSSLRGKLGK
ncbi:hypothetical protein EGI20_15545 [Aquitalea sp. S1-19]|nr:hypothetical protein [Aquitalea sp. S1-19]